MAQLEAPMQDPCPRVYQTYGQQPSAGRARSEGLDLRTSLFWFIHNHRSRARVATPSSALFKKCYRALFCAASVLCCAFCLVGKQVPIPTCLYRDSLGGGEREKERMGQSFELKRRPASSTQNGAVLVAVCLSHGNTGTIAGVACTGHDCLRCITEFQAGPQTSCDILATHPL